MSHGGSQVLVLNCGSSSVKIALLEPGAGARTLTGLADRVGSNNAAVTITRGGGLDRSTAVVDASYRHVLHVLLDSLTDQERAAVAGVGHRVVHGGPAFRQSTRIDDGVVARLAQLTDLAPLHMPANVAGIQVATRAFPLLPQVAVFDTAFHQTMPPVAYRYAVPHDWYAQHHVRRYGFHGTSHRYVSRRAADILARPVGELRTVSLHLGNGCSAAAIAGGVCVDTTMGFTPLEGLVMGTRSGDIDPGVLGYMGKRLGLGLEGVLDALNTASGLLGLSGLSSDERTLEEAAGAGDPGATLALDVFCYRVAKTVGALAVALGGLDALVFTGGIGENSPIVRAAVLDRLGVLGLHLDAAANAALLRGEAGVISDRKDAAVALTVPTDEELLIAQETFALCAVEYGALPP
jgi:acetate kinase